MALTKQGRLIILLSINTFFHASKYVTNLSAHPNLTLFRINFSSFSVVGNCCQSEKKIFLYINPCKFRRGYNQDGASLVAQMVVKTNKKICLQCERPRFDPWVGKIPWRREWLPTWIFLPGEFHGQRSLAGYVHGVSKSQTWLSYRVCIHIHIHLWSGG